jgi:hypothetical protein
MSAMACLRQLRIAQRLAHKLEERHIHVVVARLWSQQAMGPEKFVLLQPVMEEVQAWMIVAPGNGLGRGLSGFWLPSPISLVPAGRTQVEGIVIVPEGSRIVEGLLT